MITNINRFFSERSYLLLVAILLLTVITLILTLYPFGDMLPSRIWSYDKLGHLAIFGGWTFLVGYYRFIINPEGINLFLIFFIGVLFGVGIEFLQYITPYHRTADFFDIAYDALGCFIATLALYKISDTDFK